jgi:hypothetical protein
MHRTPLTVLFSAILLVIGLTTVSAKNTQSYSFRCHGVDDLARPSGSAGTIEFTSPTDAIGNVQLNLANGAINSRGSFTATFVNGTAAADGSGGNGIPTGCFTASLTIPGDSFGLMSNLFGCYTKGSKGFYAAQSGGGAQVTCEAGEM